MHRAALPLLILPLLLPLRPVLAQLGPAPLAGQAVTATGGATPRSLSSKLGDVLSVLDFGAVCDGRTDDSAAIQAAGAANRPVAIPAGLTCYAASLTWSRVPAVLVGPGQIRTSDGALRARQYSAVTAVPNPTAINSADSADVAAAYNSETGMNWDYSHALSFEEFHIAGTTTLGQPTSGYVYMPGAYAHTAYFTNESGWNQSTSGGNGRTAAIFDQVIAQHLGQGDLMVHNAEISCTGIAKPGGTSYLANPACAFEAGDISAFAPGQYLQKEEWHFYDNQNTSAAMGRVATYNRGAGTGTENEFWEDTRLDCNGGQPAKPACDGVLTVTGYWRVGQDYTSTGATVQAPLAMQANQKIVLNGTNTDFNANPGNTVLGGDWLTYDSASGTVQLADNSAPVLRLSNPAGAVNGWGMTGGATGTAVTLAPVGSDASIWSVLADKGGAGLIMMSNGNIVTKMVAGTQASSYLQLNPGSTAGSPFLVQALSASQTDIALQGAAGGAVHALGTFVVDMATPASSSASCRTGQVTFDSSYAYFCVGTNNWRRTALASW